MKVQIWGTRGSLPAPGPHTVRYGGNTSCITISIDDSTTLVLDAGTGLAAMGLEAPPPPHTYYLLLSHPHWDHIQGLPLFAPLMCPGNHIVFLTEPAPEIGQQAMSQFDGLHFPLCHDDIEADVRLDARQIGEVLSGCGVSISWQRLNHTGTCFGYRVQGPTRSLVYMTDNELDEVTGDVSYDTLLAFCRDADVLIHDSQYMDDERPFRTGWGHSFLSDVCRLARRAQVGELILFHHDYRRSDAEIDAMNAAACATLGNDVGCAAACEGMTFEI